jgi:Transposase DDE domain
MPAFANGMRLVSQHGPERERYSDPDASWGHRSAVSTRKGGGFYGYKLHLAVDTATGLPLAWQVETARRHESLFVAPLLDKLLAGGYRPETCAMDKGYDSNRCHSECVERGVHPIIPIKGEPDPTHHASPSVCLASTTWPNGTRPMPPAERSRPGERESEAGKDAQVGTRAGGAAASY